MWLNPVTAKRNAEPGPGLLRHAARRSVSSVWSGNYCCLSIRVVSIDENKHSHRKITMTHTQTTYINRIALRAGKKGARPAEFGALASVFEKSATKLKQQKLLKCKQTIQITTFNVRTLNRIDQWPELTASALEHKIDIICIQEHRYTHTEDIKYHDTGNGWTLATVSAWKNSVNATVGGVGMFIETKSVKNDEYENFVNAHLEAAAKCIPTKPRTEYRVPWETLAVREKRAYVKTASKSYRKNPTNTNAIKLKKAQ